MSKIIYTIGHSTRKIEYFIDLLKAHQIEMVIDVRTIPQSRHNPQFGQEFLKGALHENNILYRHMKGLGGLRHAKKDSENTGWENLSFRGYADYMQTEAFSEALAELEELGKKYRCAIMCSEAVPWRCHRSLIADAMTLRKWKVYHIQSKISAKLHEITPFLQIKNGRIIYATNSV